MHQWSGKLWDCCVAHRWCASTFTGFPGASIPPALERQSRLTRWLDRITGPLLCLLSLFAGKLLVPWSLFSEVPWFLREHRWWMEPPPSQSVCGWTMKKQSCGWTMKKQSFGRSVFGPTEALLLHRPDVTICCRRTVRLPVQRTATTPRKAFWEVALMFELLRCVQKLTKSELYAN